MPIHTTLTTTDLVMKSQPRIGRWNQCKCWGKNGKCKYKFQGGQIQYYSTPRDWGVAKNMKTSSVW